MLTAVHADMGVRAQREHLPYSGWRKKIKRKARSILPSLLALRDLEKKTERKVQSVCLRLIRPFIFRLRIRRESDVWCEIPFEPAIH